MSKTIKIDGHIIGEGHKPFIIAELSANHNGDLDRALETVQMAKDAGADAIKLQTYTPDTLTIDSREHDFLIKGGLWDGYNLYDLYKWAQTPFEWMEPLFKKARDIGITVFSSPFDETAVDLLESLDAPAYKIASFEAVDLNLIGRAARTKKPLIISTGMANLEEITEALECARDNGCKEVALLHCISAYPAPIDQANLKTIQDLRDKFDVVIGLSDHTLGTTAAVAAVALGASIIEKHVTLSRADKGPDSEFSLEPQELAQLCSESRAVWQALGVAGYELKPAEKANMIFRRSIYVVKDIAAGEEFTRENIRIIRPGYGLAPKHYQSILGKKAKVALSKASRLTKDAIAS